MNRPISPELLRLHAYVDGQLEVDECRQVEAYLADNPEAQARVSDYRRMNDLLRQMYEPVLQEPIPESLMAQSRPQPQESKGWWRSLGAIAAGITLLAVGLGSGFYFGVNQQITAMTTQAEIDHVVNEAAVAYSVYTPEVRHPVEVPGDQRDHLVGWLSKRMGHPINAPQLESFDMRLLGGRLLASEDGPGALLMYENPRGARLIIFACSSDEKSTAFHFAQQGNLSVFYWVDNSLTYAIAAEMDRDRLQPLAESVYNQMLF